MKKNIGSKLALYPTPVVVVGAEVDGKSDYRRLRPVLFEMPGDTYLRTGDTIGKCATMGKQH